jgi:hypothetical protein
MSHSYEENAEQTCEAEVTAAHQGTIACCMVSVTLRMLLYSRSFCRTVDVCTFSLALRVLFVSTVYREYRGCAYSLWRCACCSFCLICKPQTYGTPFTS